MNMYNIAWNNVTDKFWKTYNTFIDKQNGEDEYYE
jgi:hypothetical protein